MEIVKIIHDPDRPFHKNILNWILIFLIFCLAIFDIFILRLMIDQFDTILAINALGVTLIALVITFIIALNQQYQLNSLQEIVEALETQSSIRQAVESFFKSKDSKDRQYQLIFPVVYSSKPLPLINQGDFYAIHVVSTRLTEKKIKNEPLSLLNSSHIQIGEYVIFICSPDANPALKKIYDIQHIHRINGEIKAKKNCPIMPEELPCWFVSNDDAGDSNCSWKIRNIWVPEFNDLIPSGVTALYEEAANKKEHFEHPSGIQQDCGIFGRWHKKGKQFIVIAGIHQYGTWIIAQLLCDLCSGKPVRGKNIFLGDRDFISVIWGKFDYSTLKVTWADIYKDYIWTKNEDKWVLVKNE